MLGTALGGDPGTLYALASWLTQASRTVDEAAGALAQVARTVEADWTDDAGELYALKLNVGRVRALKLADAIAELAALVTECAGSLASAQLHMRTAEAIAVKGALAVRNHIIVPPTWGERPGGVAMPIYDRDQLEGLYGTEEIKQWYEARVATYRQAEADVEAACRILDDLLGRLTGDDLPWSDMVFTLADITGGTLEHHVNLLEASHRRQAEWASRTTGDWRSRADATRRYARYLKRLLDLYDANAADSAHESRTAYIRAARLGILAKVLRAGGPLLTIVSGAYAVYAEDSPWQKVAIQTAAGAAAAGFVYLGFFFVTGPVGMIIAAGAAGLLVSDISGFAYDDIEPARVRISRSNPDLDPGSTGLDWSR